MKFQQLCQPDGGKWCLGGNVDGTAGQAQRGGQLCREEERKEELSLSSSTVSVSAWLDMAVFPPTSLQ